MRSLMVVLCGEVCSEEKELAICWHPRCSRLNEELLNTFTQLIFTSPFRAKKSKVSGKFWNMLTCAGSESHGLRRMPGEMRAERAEGDSKRWKMGELCDGPHGQKGHKPHAEGSDSLPVRSRKPYRSENPQKCRRTGKLQPESMGEEGAQEEAWVYDELRKRAS